jgi:hypothetical protein
MLVLEGFDGSAHPSQHWLVHRAINLAQEVERGFMPGCYRPETLSR